MMGPGDFLKLWAGHKMRREESERELYLLRLLVVKVHNTLSAKKDMIRDPSRIMPLEIDKDIKKSRKKSAKQVRAKSDYLFSRARERGLIAQSNEE